MSDPISPASAGSPGASRRLRWAAALAVGVIGSLAAGMARPARSAVPARDGPLAQTLWRVPLVRQGLMRTVLDSQATPVVDEAGGQVLCGTGEGEVVAVDLHSSRLRWRYRGREPIEGAATLLPGDANGSARVVVGAKDGGLIALDAAFGRLLWRTELDAEARAAPILDGARLLVTTANNQLTCLDAETGAGQWTAGRPSPTGMTVLGHAGALRVDERVFTAFSDGFAMAVGAQDGAVLWQRPLTLGAARFRDADATPVALGGAIAFASLADGVYALAAETGATLWQQPLQNVAHLACAPCTGDAEGRLFAGDADGRVYALAAHTGRIVWRTAVEPEPIRAIYVGGDALYLLSPSSGLRVLNRRDGRLLGSLALGGHPGGGLAVGERHLAHLTAQGALFAWRRPHPVTSLR